MGRRIVPKLDPYVDFSAHLFELDALAKNPEFVASGSPPDHAGDFVPCLSVDKRPLFPLVQPLELEIGCGKGLFLCNASTNHPDRNYLGVEIAKKYARFSAYRLAKLGRSNARVVRGDGVALMRECLPNSCLAAIHVYYPDPWWKARHRKRRVVRAEFATQAHRTLRPGGFLIFWTDVEEYFAEGCQSVREACDWNQLAEPPPRFRTDSADGQTHFDRRMIRNEHDVFRVCFQKPIGDSVR